MRAFRVRLFQDALPVIMCRFFHAKQAARRSQVAELNLSTASCVWFQLKSQMTQVEFWVFVVHLPDVFVQLPNVQEKHFNV